MNPRQASKAPIPCVWESIGSGADPEARGGGGGKGGGGTVRILEPYITVLSMQAIVHYTNDDVP